MQCETASPPVGRPLPNIHNPPPTIPAALGTDLYPTHLLEFDPCRPIELQMREYALTRQRRERDNYYRSKHADFIEFREENCRSFRYCRICSEHVNDRRQQMRVVNHSHFSSLIYRMKARTDKWGDFVCLTCQAGVHSIKSGIRYPVLVTSSTMNLWQKV